MLQKRSYGRLLLVCLALANVERVTSFCAAETPQPNSVKPKHVVIVMAVDEYDTHRTLPEFARTHLAKDGDRGEIEVVVTLDAGPPTLLYRRVLLPVRLGAADAHGLVDALERTEVTMMLRPAFQIRTQIEHAGEPLH